MIRRSGLRWRLVAWAVGVMATALAIVFVLVYQQTGAQLRARVDADVRGDVGQLQDAVHALRPLTVDQLTSRLRRYVLAQPYSGSSALLLAIVPGHGTISNHPELFGAARPDDGESAVQQRRENALGNALVHGATGRYTVRVPDVGLVRLDQRLVSVAGVQVRLAAGEALQDVSRAQRSVARSFLIAGAIGLGLVLLASFLAATSVSRPLRRMARASRSRRRRRPGTPHAPRTGGEP